jgi:hypothetical protein
MSNHLTKDLALIGHKCRVKALGSRLYQNEGLHGGWSQGEPNSSKAHYNLYQTKGKKNLLWFFN